MLTISLTRVWKLAQLFSHTVSMDQQIGSKKNNDFISHEKNTFVLAHLTPWYRSYRIDPVGWRGEGGGGGGVGGLTPTQNY